MFGIFIVGGVEQQAMDSNLNTGMMAEISTTIKKKSLLKEMREERNAFSLGFGQGSVMRAHPGH